MKSLIIILIYIFSCLAQAQYGTGGIYHGAGTPAVQEGHAGVFGITPYRGVHINLRSANGTELLGQKPMSSSVPVVLASGATYSYSNGANPFTPAANPSVILSIQGSATKTIYVYSLLICATATLAAGHTNFYLARRSTAPTAGTSATVTANILDTSDAGATATIRQWSADPTAAGALVGTLQSRWMFFGMAGSSTIENGCVDMIRGYGEDYNDNSLKPYTLRGTSEYLNFEKNDEALPQGFAIQSYRIITAEE